MQKFVLFNFQVSEGSVMEMCKEGPNMSRIHFQILDNENCPSCDILCCSRETSSHFLPVSYTVSLIHSCCQLVTPLLELRVIIQLQKEQYYYTFLCCLYGKLKTANSDQALFHIVVSSHNGMMKLLLSDSMLRSTQAHHCT